MSGGTEQKEGTDQHRPESGTDRSEDENLVRIDD